MNSDLRLPCIWETVLILNSNEKIITTNLCSRENSRLKNKLAVICFFFFFFISFAATLHPWALQVEKSEGNLFSLVFSPQPPRILTRHLHKTLRNAVDFRYNGLPGCKSCLAKSKKAESKKLAQLLRGFLHLIVQAVCHFLMICNNFFFFHLTSLLLQCSALDFVQLSDQVLAINCLWHPGWW